jgi:hypothetical protein
VQQVIYTLLESSRLLLPYCCHESLATNRMPFLFRHLQDFQKRARQDSNLRPSDS